MTSIVWHAEHRSPPYHLVRFDAGFENGIEGTGFRYSVRYAPRANDGHYTATFRAFDSIEKEAHLQALEAFARTTLQVLISEAASSDGAASDAAEV